MSDRVKEPGRPVEFGSAQRRRGHHASGLHVVLAILVAVVSGCDVVNPGPVNDEFLNLPSAHQAFVDGSQQKLIESINNVGVAGSHAARTLMPGGATGIAGTGHDPIEQAGQWLPNSSRLEQHWSEAQQARWIAEEAIRRFSDGTAGDVAPTTFALAYLWAGYSNRLLGENFCEAVFDGGPKEPNIRYFERAETNFTEAIAKGSGDVKTAAYAGRASVRVWLNDFAGAVTDALQVPRDFEYFVDAEGPSLQTHNTFFHAMGIFPWKSISVWMTFYDDYYRDTGDPRVPWDTDPVHPLASGSLSGFGAVPFLFQTKYESRNSDYRVSSGREAILIRAEALLVAGDFPGAMTLINDNRTAFISDVTEQPLEPWVANSIDDAWTFLKRERGIEFWMEARRLGDIRRWSEDGTPGVLDFPDWENTVSTLFSDFPASNCFPIPDTEIETNLNF